MDELKQQIQQTLIANVVKDKCKNNSGLIFDEAWCTQNRCIRFTTPFFRNMFETKPGKGNWQTGDYVMYEINMSGDRCVAECVSSAKDMNYQDLDKLDKIKAVTTGDSVVGSWELGNLNEDNEKLFEAVDHLLNNIIPAFENEVANKADLFSQKDGRTTLSEGEQFEIYTSRYERNAEARKKCLEALGTACAVCGIDFGKEYGPEFEGKIEVHHIVPLSKIGKEYVVDPIKDLVPVCPNCHMALHSKKGGVYTVEELRKMIKNK